MRRIAGLVFATLLTTGAASASSFVTPEPMTAKLGPSMVMLGEPADRPIAAIDRTKPTRALDKTVATATDEAPLDYPFPGDRRPASAQPAGGADFVRVSASIIAMAEPEPAVSFEQVAAVDKDADDSEAERQRDLFGPLPTVIRGGVVDNGGPAEISAPSVQAEKPSQSPVASRQAASSSQQPPKQPDVPIPSPTPAPLPANIIPQTKIQ
jgi:hypothetical protein